MTAYLQQLPFWGMLSETQQALVRAGAVIRHYEKGQYLHGGTADCQGMMLLLAGELRAYLVSEEGREITLFHLYAGAPCVFTASCAISQITLETLICAEQPSRMLVLHTALFAQLTQENLYVRCFQYELIAERFSSVMWTLQEILFKGFDRRLASFLVAECDRRGTQTLHMTHEQIAQRVSSAREVVARMLKRFEADGLVQMQRGVLHVVALDKLRTMQETRAAPVACK